MGKQSIGTRLHLLRLHLGWSVEECAYRLTVSSNQLIAPGTWRNWEGATDSDLYASEFINCLDSICATFGTASDWLLDGDTSDSQNSAIVELSRHRPD